MSGWTLPDLAKIAFGLFFVAMGVMNLIDPPEHRATDAQLRYGDGGADLRPRAVVRWPWVVFILLGLFYIFMSRTGPGDDPYLLIFMGGILLAFALIDLVAGPWLDRRRLRRHEARLARVAAGSETYTGELRALQANPPPAVSPRRRAFNIIFFTFFGGSFLALGLNIPR